MELCLTLVVKHIQNCPLLPSIGLSLEDEQDEEESRAKKSASRPSSRLSTYMASTRRYQAESMFDAPTRIKICARTHSRNPKM